MPLVRNVNDYIGKKYGFLTILSGCEKILNTQGVLTLCDCGKKIKYGLSYVLNGHNISCGCKRGKSGLHNLSDHPIYIARLNMLARCYNPNHKSYINYGARGISGFEKFYEWCIQNGWKKGLQIDRINNDGNYEPVNCRITTVDINQNNKRNTKYFIEDGETLSLSQISKKHNVCRKLVWARLKKGWTLDRALHKVVK